MSAKNLTSVGLILVMAGFAGCKSAPKHTEPQNVPQTTLTSAGTSVQIQGKSGTSTGGTLHLSDTDKGLHVTGTLTGLTPGMHGLHVHEKGDCSAKDASSAGSHFMVGEQTHGAPGKKGSHAGDLGNVKANKKGEAKIDKTFAGLTLAEGPNSVMGRSIVVHAKTDDFKTQPSGASGDRVGCGEVK
jgi:Cu-Zn family superoxide dismutase